MAYMSLAYMSLDIKADHGRQEDLKQNIEKHYQNVQCEVKYISNDFVSMSNVFVYPRSV